MVILILIKKFRHADQTNLANQKTRIDQKLSRDNSNDLFLIIPSVFHISGFELEETIFEKAFSNSDDMLSSCHSSPESSLS